jgi:CRP/FNR family cyclic AMP-dependent transcriptional regulator
MRFFDWPAPDSVGYQDSISIVIVEHNLDLVLALAGKGDQESWFKTCRCGDCGYIGRMPVSSPDLKAFLLATPFFGGLSDASLDLLISMLAERSFDAGATIFAEGEPGRSMFVVHSGDLVVSKLGDSGRSIRMTDLGPGDFFGEMTLIEMQNRSATVVAETATVLYELTARNLYAYYKADIHAYVIVMQNINRELCRRLRRADRRIAELSFRE